VDGTYQVRGRPIFSRARAIAAWVTDITYPRTQSGWDYLAVILDLFSRKVVGWALEDHMETSLCLDALQYALRSRQHPTGTLHHSDRGCQYTRRAYTTALKNAGFIQSMSRKENCWDNAVAESFSGTLKQERVRKTIYTDTEEAQAHISGYIHGF
jgi:transposase InsO family protein